MPKSSPQAAPAEGLSGRDRELRQRVLEYLGSHHTMSVATDGPDGLWAATVFYVNIGFDLYFQSIAVTRHARNLVANARVAATISTDAEDWRAVQGIQLEGSAEPVTDRDVRMRVLKAFFFRYPFVETLWGGEKSGADILARDAAHLVFRVRPERLLFVDHGYADDRVELEIHELTLG